jgi:bifunctional non-homologous end joining protein LigD
VVKTKSGDSPQKIKAAKHTVEISSTDKVLFPEDGITKGDLINYYQKIAVTILPYLKDRPLIMNRFPDGIGKQGFFQQEISDYYPDWMARLPVQKANGTTTHVLCQDTASLIYLVNQNCITFHVWMSRQDRLQYPDQLIFDLDPPGDDFASVREAAIILRKFLNELDLDAFLKTTGSRGLHVIVPLDRSQEFTTVRKFARDIAEEISRREPDRLTAEQRIEARKGRILVDYVRNSYGQAAIAAYSVRAKPGAPVAAPLDWDELSNQGLDSHRYNIKNIFARLSQKKDPWEGMGRKAYPLVKAQKKLGELNKEAKSK